MTNEWVKIEETNTTWNGKDEDGVWKLKDGDEIMGKYLGKKENIGRNKSLVYEIETDKGTMGVWGSTVLDTRLKNVKEGDGVKIIYKGLVKSERTKREYHDYDVYHKAIDEPLDNIPVVEDDDINVADLEY